MVAVRKFPAAPPTTSRTSSSQTLPKPKAQTNLAPKPSSSPTSDKPAATKAKLTKTNQKLTTKKSRSWTQRISILLLGLFSVYAFAVCPTDHPRTSSVCHSLDYYRTYVLDPYLVPPIQHLIHQVEPHLAPLKPYAGPTISFARTHIAPPLASLASLASDQFQTRVLPAYYKYIYLTLWSQTIKPNYFIHVHPKIYPYAKPYILHFKHRILPVLRQYLKLVTDVYTRAKPYAIRTTAHARVALDTGMKHACDAYKTAKPHVQAAYVRARPHVISLGESIKVHGLALFKQALLARKVYVDPHIRRIWEKVMEARPKQADTGESVLTATPTKPVNSVYEAEQTITSSPSPVPPPPVYVGQTVTIEKTLTITEREPPATTVQAHPSPSESTSIVIDSSSSVPPPPDFETTPVPVTEPEADKAASVIAESLHPGSVGVAAQEKPADPENVDDFLKDLGLTEDESEELKKEEEIVVNAAAEQQTEGEQTQIPVEPKTDRADIVSRHDKWESELLELVKKAEAEVRNVLAVIRNEAVAEVEKYGSDKGMHKKTGVVAVVEQEAERFITGLEGYLKGMEKRVKLLTSDAGSPEKMKGDVEREQKTWWKVLEKTKEKFKNKVGEVQTEVHEWYKKVREQEGYEIEKAVLKVKTFAENAQSDLGLDYAWLPDVTHLDWQRYHDLVRVSENFTVLATALQSGDHSEPAAHSARADPLEDVLLAALGGVERDVGDVLHGFGSLVGDVGRTAARMFGEAMLQIDEKTAENPGAETEKEEKVSILPVDPEATPGLEEGVEQLILGRSKEEVEGKLKAANVGVTKQEDEL